MNKSYKLEGGSLYKSTKDAWVHVAKVPLSCSTLDEALEWYLFG